MRKKALAFLCVFLSLVMLVGCSKAPAPQSGGQTEGGTEGEWKFERPIEIVCPWGVGGGADTTIRPMAELLTDILGCKSTLLTLKVQAAPGVEYTYQQPADGYTFMLGTQSLILMGPQDIMSMDFRDEFIPVTKLVHSISIIAASARPLRANTAPFLR